MASFFAMAWDPGAAGADAVASRLHAALIEGQQAPVAQAAWPGFALYDLTQGAAKHRIIDGGDASVAAFGTMFRQGPVNERAPALSTFSSADAHTLKQSAGLALQRNFWGDYVAFIQTDDAVEILTDPAGSIPSTTGLVRHRLVFSHLELLPVPTCRFYTQQVPSYSELRPMTGIADGRRASSVWLSFGAGTASPCRPDRLTPACSGSRARSAPMSRPARARPKTPSAVDDPASGRLSAQPYDSIMVNALGRPRLRHCPCRAGRVGPEGAGHRHASRPAVR